MVYLISFIALALATARLTRVLVFDEVAAPLRNWVLTRWPAPSKPAKLATCYWCSGFWVSLILCAWTHGTAVAAGWLSWQTLPLLPVAVFAVAYASSWVLDKEGI